MRKRWYDPLSEVLGTFEMTPYSIKEKARRRRRNKAARLSRRRNRA
jgi:hypothetical protein